MPEDELTKMVARDVLDALDAAMQQYAEQHSDATRADDIKVLCGVAIGMAQSMAGAIEALTWFSTERREFAHCMKDAVKIAVTDMCLAIAKSKHQSQSIRSVLLSDVIDHLNNLSDTSRSFHLGEVPTFTPPNIDSN